MQCYGEYGSEIKIKFKEQHLSYVLSTGGAITTDGVKLKVQNKHYYDFTLHHFVIKRPQTLTDSPTFTIKTTTIALTERPKIPNAANIRAALNEKLNENYGIEFSTMRKNFTFVTDGAAIMANVAGTSVNRSASEQGGNWMRCYEHVLNNVMKTARNKCEKSSVLARVHQDFNALKKIVSDSNRAGWNSSLTQGYHLEQAIER